MPLLLFSLRPDSQGKLCPAANVYCDVVVPHRKGGFVMGMMMEYEVPWCFVSNTATTTTTPIPVNRKKTLSVQMGRQEI